MDFAVDAQQENLVDNQVEIVTDFCTSPQAATEFPVKIMFVIDGSGSLQFTDQNLQRRVAVEAVINRFIGQPGVSFSIIVFNASITSVPSALSNNPPFTNDFTTLLSALNNLAEADSVTDYQGALSVARNQLLRDMLDVQTDPTQGPAALARTRYVVTFISDGLPAPQCQVGLGNDVDSFGMPDPLCENQDFLNCLLQTQGTTCNGGICDFNGTLCFEQPNAATLFGGLSATELVAGNDYNQPYQIISRVQDIMDLRDRFEVGDIQVNTGFVFDPSLPQAILNIIGDPAAAQPLMAEMARVGEGEALVFSGGDSIDFLSVNFDSLDQNRVVTGFYAYNLNAKGGLQGFDNDTDGDGLNDLEEFGLGTDSGMADSDGDGYSDRIEVKLAPFGLDPNDPCQPNIIDVPGIVAGTACTPSAPHNCNFINVNIGGVVQRQYVDTDRDGLPDCAERILGSDSASVDTDRDGFVDFIEVHAGTDPLRDDAGADSDQDGTPNAQEITWHLNPLLDQPDAVTRDRYRYSRNENGMTTADNRPCFDAVARRIRLASTVQNADQPNLGVGFNRIYVTIRENLSDNLEGLSVFRTACLDARYVQPSLKVPASGRITIPESAFMYLPGQDPIFNNPQIQSNLFDINRCACIDEVGNSCDAALQ